MRSTNTDRFSPRIRSPFKRLSTYPGCEKKKGTIACRFSTRRRTTCSHLLDSRGKFDPDGWRDPKALCSSMADARCRVDQCRVEHLLHGFPLFDKLHNIVSSGERTFRCSSLTLKSFAVSTVTKTHRHKHTSNSG